LRILLVRLRQIGDVVFTTPAVRALRRQYPGAHIAYVVEPAAADVLRGNPHLNELIVAPITRGVARIATEYALIRRLRAQRFDLAIDFHGGPRGSLVTWLSGAPRRIGYHVMGRSWMYTQVVERPRALRARHSVENQWDLLRAIGIDPPDRSRDGVEMPTDPAAAARVADWLATAGVGPHDRLVVIHVSAGNPFRRWPIESFAEVAATLARDAQTRIVITAGPSEQVAARQVVAGARSRLEGGASTGVLDYRDLSLSELRAALDRAALYIGGDSGPLHVAATSAAPIVGIYGPTLPIRSEPWRDGRFTTEAVEISGLPCRPCDQRSCTPGDFRCLSFITPAFVLQAADRALERAERLQKDPRYIKMTSS